MAAHVRKEILKLQRASVDLWDGTECHPKQKASFDRTKKKKKK